MPKVEKLETSRNTRANADSPRIVFRLYECVVRLEIAIENLANVGIAQGPEAEDLIAAKNKIHADLTTLLANYKKQWNAYQKL